MADNKLAPSSKNALRGDVLVDPGQPTWYDRLFQKGLSMLPSETNLFSDTPRPTNERIFIETVGKGRTNPITESDFHPDELTQLQRLVAQNYKTNLAALQHDLNYNLDLAQRTGDAQTKSMALQKAALAKQKLLAFQQNPQGSIGYQDYKNAPENLDLSQSENSQGRLQTTLGRFGYSIDPKTNMINITDKYKFNTYQTPDNMQEARVNSMIESAGAGNVYPLIRNSAGRLLPPSRGVPVQINLEYPEELR